MTITRERQPDFAGRQAHWCRDPRFCQRALPWVRDIHRKYAGRGEIRRKPTPFFGVGFCRT